MLTYIDEPAHKTVELIINGKIHKDEYEDIADHLRRRISEWGKVNLVENIQNFDGAELGAIWQNTKFALHHMGDIGKCAVVTDKKWLRTMTDAVDPLISVSVKTFAREELDQAREWAIR